MNLLDKRLRLGISASILIACFWILNTALEIRLILESNSEPQTVEVIEEVEVIKEVIVEVPVTETRILNHGINEGDVYNLVYNVMIYLEEPNPRDFTALLIATARAESDMGQYLRQMNNGVARSIFQVEPNTEKDVFEHYLKYNPKLKDKIMALMGVEIQGLDNLTYNFAYAIAIAYSCYKRHIDVPPNKDDKKAQAELHKKYYNTVKGKATVEKTMAKL